ncbi:MAG: hypothetical protein KF819_26435 [Labilithrix sp.]|nr:hypothetical protein [Labilithrix sp.]
MNKSLKFGFAVLVTSMTVACAASTEPDETSDEAVKVDVPAAEIRPAGPGATVPTSVVCYTRAKPCPRRDPFGDWRCYAPNAYGYCN